MPVLIKPIISEKSLNQAAQGFYTFAVKPWARKPVIRKAVEETFGVKVLAIRTARFKGKTVRVGKKLKTLAKSDWKKAIVQLPKEQKIDLFEVKEK